MSERQGVMGQSVYSPPRLKLIVFLDVQLDPAGLNANVILSAGEVLGDR